MLKMVSKAPPGPVSSNDDDGWCDGRLFRAYIIGLVVLSSLVLAVQVELPPERWEAHRAIERMELFILLSFIVEIGQTLNRL